MAIDIVWSVLSLSSANFLTTSSCDELPSVSPLILCSIPSHSPFASSRMLVRQSRRDLSQWAPLRSCRLISCGRHCLIETSRSERWCTDLHGIARNQFNLRYWVLVLSQALNSYNFRVHAGFHLNSSTILAELTVGVMWMATPSKASNEQLP